MAKPTEKPASPARRNVAIPPTPGPLEEIGHTGLVIMGGQVQEELLRQLSGTQGIRAYKEMSENDPVVGAMLFAIERIIRGVEWDVEPFSDEAQDQERADLVNGMRDDMSLSWSDTIAEILSMLVYGWSYIETVYKLRKGLEQEDASLRSRFTDGLIGIRKLAIRSQDSLYKWETDADGGISGMWQQVLGVGTKYIPIERALLFRTVARKNSPQGKSILRNAYRPWFFKKRIEEIEAIGIERELNGIPVAWAPSDVLTGTSPDKVVLRTALEKIVKSIKTDEQAGLLFPMLYDENNNKMFDLTLLSNAGRRAVDTSAVINRYDQRIAMTTLSDMILLGHGGYGNRSMHDSKTSLFSAALESFLDTIADVLNRHLVPRLFSANTWPLDRPCKFTHEDVESIDLASLADYIQKLSGSGMPIFPSEDGELENHLLRMANLPAVAEGKAKPMRPVAPPPVDNANGTQDAPPPKPPSTFAAASS